MIFVKIECNTLISLQLNLTLVIVWEHANDAKERLSTA